MKIDDDDVLLKGFDNDAKFGCFIGVVAVVLVIWFSVWVFKSCSNMDSSVEDKVWATALTRSKSMLEYPDTYNFKSSKTTDVDENTCIIVQTFSGKNAYGVEESHIVSVTYNKNTGEEVPL